MSEQAAGIQCFYFGPDQRSVCLEEHKFYIDQAKKRLLSQFEHIDDDAKKAGDMWEVRSRPWVDPEANDPAGFYEEAWDVEVNHFLMLTELHNQTFLSVVAGFYHQWEKRLKEILQSEVASWCPNPNVVETIWGRDVKGILELVVGLNLINAGDDCLRKLNECRLVVNVFKHGAGRSLRELVNDYPEYLVRGENAIGNYAIEYEPYLFHYLQVGEVQVDSFSDAIVAFWNELAERSFASDVTGLPKWFVDACGVTTASED